MSSGHFSHAFSDAFDTVRLEYDESLLWSGQAVQEDYGWNKQPSAVRIGSLKGRPRFLLTDPHAPVQMQVNMDLSDEDFNEWQTYWAVVTDYGSKAFPMRLMLDRISTFQDLPEGYYVQPIGPYDARSQGPNRWRVSLAVEIPITADFRIFICNTVYGGPLDDLSDTEIYGGPIATLDPIEVYGGPLWLLAPDEVYGGPLDDLSDDVMFSDANGKYVNPAGIIAPCKGVLNV